MDPQIREVRFERLVHRQYGLITRAQLHRLGVSDTRIRGWLETKRLHRVLPKVYAVGHRAPSREADLSAAILYAGPGAMLSHGTAAHWCGLIDYPPRRIEVSTPRDIKSLAHVKVYPRRSAERRWVKGIPVTSIEQILLGVAATLSYQVVRRALSNLDYRHQLDDSALTAICQRGRPGSTRLKQALDDRQPQLAHTNGRLEDRFLAFCERYHLRVPSFNVRVHGIRVDAYWPEHQLVVEVDGYDNHSSPAQLHRDKRNDLILRSHGLAVLRYDWRLLRDRPELVHQDVLRAQGNAPR